MNDLIKVDNSSGLAKYKQIIHSILGGIEEGKLQVGDKIPSLNVLVREHGLSQDTVLSAYNELKHRGIISSSVGKGYFIARTDVQERHNIFVLFDKMTTYKEELYESMKSAAGSRAVLDIYFHHGNQKAFNALIRNAMGNYTAFVIVPIVGTTSDKILAEIPKKKLFIIDQGIARYGKKYRSVCQNFELDISRALEQEKERIDKYKKIYFVHEDQRQQFRELEKGFVDFCSQNQIQYELLANLKDHEIQSGEMYILVDDKELVRLIKKTKWQQLIPGRDIGVISYNDSPFKEIIADGITTITTDFGQMGQSVIEMIFENKTRHLENPSKLILRNSF
jgi:DNA-binding transcriptional regulator YhcF (GntR family)